MSLRLGFSYASNKMEPLWDLYWAETASLQSLFRKDIQGFEMFRVQLRKATQWQSCRLPADLMLYGLWWQMSVFCDFRCSQVCRMIRSPRRLYEISHSMSESCDLWVGRSWIFGVCCRTSLWRVGDRQNNMAKGLRLIYQSPVKMLPPLYFTLYFKWHYLRGLDTVDHISSTVIFICDDHSDR